MERKTYTAKLKSSELLSAPAQTKHLEFEIPGPDRFDFLPGQFISLVAPREGKLQTRAYSLASAPRGDNSFDLCLNRVEHGFFSNLLCDLEPEGEITFHGPHGLFVLRNPVRDSLWIAADTGIAPIRGFVESLFGGGEDRSNGRRIHLVYGAERETNVYYREYLESIAARFPNFHYLVTLSCPANQWPGECGPVQSHVRKIIESRPPEIRNEMDAYVCGLNDMVSANRKMLQEMGWSKKQIVYERYD